MATATANGNEQKSMTQSQLVSLIKDVVGKEMAEIIRGQMEAAVKTALGGEDRLEHVRRLAAAGSVASSVTDPKQREKGHAFARIVRAAAASRNNPDRAPEFLKSWGDDDLAEGMIQARKDALSLAAVINGNAQLKALSAGAGLDGGFLVPPQYSQDIIDLLRPAVVVRSLNPVVLPMPTGTVRVPKLTGASQAYYVGENIAGTPSQQTFGQLTLSFKKLIAVVPLSNDLIRYSSPGADSIVRDDVVRQMAIRENQAFLRDDGTSNTPKGLRYWAPPANILGSAGTWATLANIVTDAGAMILALRNANVPMTRPAWIFSPAAHQRLLLIQNTNGFFVFKDEVSQGRFLGFPFGITTQMPFAAGSAEIGLVDFADAVIGESQSLIVDASQEAAYWDGTQIQAAFSNDQTVIRALQEHDFAMRRSESVAWMTGMTV